ncbi:MAG: N-acetylmannosamine-6-phosphate 2-epimerase [Acetobacter sp.]|nr:N-acetylmannosamine-6-phosphate 2-epimerase [Bacteroides sp.]MCM1342105.1 N-acetylmannosamine-6-phosphate 2-epimerase [Acetobacter sp.]MCM1434317.1 N-acetylmannosamine-6-phosphate 2-epimerase [Clostridiales bacterium]
MTNTEILNQIQGKLIVSCQALETEPLYDSYIMAKMAWAAYLGGAAGIRANTIVDIKAIKEKVDLPVIGIIKQIYDDSDVYITPTEKEVDELVKIGCEIIAVDATDRLRPNGVTFEEFFTKIRKKYPDQLFMADTSCFEEGKKAEELGFDLIGTTMAGYTPYTKGTPLPDFSLMERYVKELHTPVIAEGGIWVPEELKKAIDIGVHAAVIGTAITRPMDITKHFVSALEK